MYCLSSWQFTGSQNHYNPNSNSTVNRNSIFQARYTVQRKISVTFIIVFFIQILSLTLVLIQGFSPNTFKRKYYDQTLLRRMYKLTATLTSKTTRILTKNLDSTNPAIKYLNLKRIDPFHRIICYCHNPTSWSYCTSSKTTLFPQKRIRSTSSRLFSSTVDRIMNDDMVNSPNNNDDIKNYTEYELWVRRLYATNLFHPVKLGLDNMKVLHNAIGNPMDDTTKVTVIHIAGTNGKGSVALKIAKTLQYCNPNLKVGLFCSPHVSSFRERMQINDELITEAEVVQILPNLYHLCKLHDIPATFFEITTMLAFQYYALHNVNVVVLETGLGGRLDATNIIQHPALSVITSIGLEHTRILGDTIELIAMEKGGIIKENCPVLVGPNVPHSTLRQCAKEKGASQYLTCDDVLGVSPNAVDQQNDYDLENSRIATAAIKLLQQSHSHLFASENVHDSIQKGVSHRPPCRFELVKYTTSSPSDSKNSDIIEIILDVAHNPPAMEYLAYKLRATYPDRKFRVVVGMSSDKDMTLCAKSLKKIVQNDIGRIHLVEAAHPRAASLEDMWQADPELQQYAQYDVTNRSISNQILNAIDAIEKSCEVSTSTEDKDMLVVCGSVFLMAEARETLGYDEPRDSKYIAQLAGAGVRHGQENFGNRSL